MIQNTHQSFQKLDLLFIIVVCDILKISYCKDKFII